LTYIEHSKAPSKSPLKAMDTFLDDHSNAPSKAPSIAPSNAPSKTPSKAPSKAPLKAMDTFLDDHADKTDDYQEQKKIVIKHRKIKKATRTYLYNITDWLDSDDIKTVAKTVKQKLGTSSQVITDDEGTALTFNGDHTQEIQQLMLKACNKLSPSSFL